MPTPAYLRKHRVKELTPDELRRLDQLAMHYAINFEDVFKEIITKEHLLSGLLKEENEDEYLAGYLLFKNIVSSALRNKLNV